MSFGHCCMGISLKIIPQLYYAYELVKDITNIPVTNWGTMLIMPLPSVFQNILFEELRTIAIPQIFKNDMKT